jgi:hypothetical protein
MVWYPFQANALNVFSKPYVRNIWLEQIAVDRPPQGSKTSHCRTQFLGTAEFSTITCDFKVVVMPLYVSSTLW